MTLVVSIDPGLTGACAVLDHRGVRTVFDLPTMEIPGVGENTKIKNKIDARALAKHLRTVCPADEAVQSVVERVQVMADRGSGLQQQGSLQRTLGAIEATLEILCWRPAYAHPQTWKRWYGLIDGAATEHQRKQGSLECARRLYPHCGEITRSKDHNRAEAILIGHWWMRTST